MDSGSSRVAGLTTRIAVGLATLNAPTLLDRCMASVVSQDGLSVADVIVVMNGPAVADVCARWEQRGVHVARPGWNIGTCRAWNYCLATAFIKRGYDGVLIVNDDLELTDHRTIDMFAERLATNPRKMWFVKDRGFSGVCIPKIVAEEIALPDGTFFDEAFYPAYYEDNDAFRRFTLVGIEWEHVPVESRHVGSASLKMNQAFADANAVAFRLNTEYYKAKWGGVPHNEQFVVPWNGGRPPMPGTIERLPARVREVLEHRYA